MAVNVAGKRKMTAEARGKEEIRSEETLDFLIGGEVVDQENEMIKVEVWDVTFVSSDLVRLDEDDVDELYSVGPPLTWRESRGL